MKNIKESTIMLTDAEKQVKNGINATPKAPAAMVKKKKSGILKAAKNAAVLSGPVSGKLALIKRTLKKPISWPRIDAATSKEAAPESEIRLLARFKNRFTA